MNKKKYYIFSLVLLFGMLSATFSTCYANVSEEYVTYLMESIRDEGTFLNNSTTNKTYVSNFLNNTDNITTLTNQLNNRLATHNWNNLGDYNLFATFQTSSSNIKIKFCFSNCTFPNGVTDVGYTQFRGNYFGPYNSENNLIVYLTLNNSPSYSEYFTTGTSEYYDYIDRHVNTDYTTVYFDNVYNYIPTQSIYIANAYNQLSGALLNDTRGTYQNNLPIEPEDPSGDITTGGTGTITNNSGDTTGKIDLSGIEQGIGNLQNQISGDTQKVIDNQNQNTQTIVNSISGEVNKINNTLTEYDENEGEEGVNDLINNIQTSLSGDLNNSEIFGALEESEKGFLNLISGQAEDFILSWNDVFYQGVKLIPAGSINFNALCRENQSLSNVKEKLNIILSALCGLALIKYLYNLLLATLGIDNPYLYDKTSDSHINNSSVTVRDTTKVNYNVYDKHGNITGWGRDEK